MILFEPSIKLMKIHNYMRSLYIRKTLTQKKVEAI